MYYGDRQSLMVVCTSFSSHSGAEYTQSRQSLPSTSIHHQQPPTPHSHRPLHSHRRKSDFAHWTISCPFSGMGWVTVSCRGCDQVRGSPLPPTSWSSAWIHPRLHPRTSISVWWSPSPPPVWSASWRDHSLWTLSGADWRENFLSPLGECYLLMSWRARESIIKGFW